MVAQFDVSPGADRNVLRGRTCIIQVGTVKLPSDSLHAEFAIRRNLKLEPNTCSLVIYNLSPDKRAELEELQPKASTDKGIPCQIDAGYESTTSTIWLGDLRNVYSTWDGVDWRTVLEAGDAEKNITNARTNRSFAKNTPVATVIKALVQDLAVKPGNTDDFIAKFKTASGSSIFAQGITLSGPAPDELEQIAISLGVRVSIQNGAIQFIEPGKPLSTTTAVKLSPTSGLIGSPTVDPQGLVTATSLMNPDIRPGALIVLESSRVKGRYLAEDVSYHGSTQEGAWDVQFTGPRV